VEYGGPILITLGLLLFRKQIYGASVTPLTFRQKIGVGMALFHYIKRELETIFVHRFSNDTMPFMNIFKNSAHYWILFGICSMLFFLKPSVDDSSRFKEIVLAGLFLLFELLNFSCHIILKNLRKEGSTERGIPMGCGFGQVSCANYLWEACAWTTFALVTKVWGSWLFVGVSTVQMTLWALKKHKRY
jgi:very-long-chain enoyl-CoA reductase